MHSGASFKHQDLIRKNQGQPPVATKYVALCCMPKDAQGNLTLESCVVAIHFRAFEDLKVGLIWAMSLQVAAPRSRPVACILGT